MASNPSQRKPEFQFKRGADPGVGKDYERFVIALIMARCFYYSSPDLPEREFDDFDFGFNLKNLGNVDDVVIFLKKNQEPLMNIAVQLKHSNRPKLSGAMLCGDKGEFALEKYLQNVNTITAKIDKYILFTNLSFNEYEIMTKFDKKVKEYSIRKHNGLKLIQTNSEINEVCSFNPTTESLQQNSEFFDKFFLYANQKPWFQMEEEVKNTLNIHFDADEHSQNVYIELCSWWHNEKVVKDVIPREPKLNRRGVGKMLVVSLLKPFLVTVQPPAEYQNQWEILTKASTNFVVTVIVSNVCKNWTIPLEDKHYSVWADQFTQPLIVKSFEAQDSNQVLRAIHIMNEIGQHKNLIVLGSLDTKKIKKEVNLFKNLGNLDQHILEEVLTEFHLSLETLLNLFKKEKKVILNEITPSLLFDMIITNKDKKAAEKLPECYVPRTIEAPIIYNISIISKIIKNAFIFLIIDSHSKYVEEILTKIDNKIPVVKIKNVNKEINFYDTLNAFRKTHPKQNVYFFKIFTEDAKLEWILSDGPNIQKLDNPKIKEINENTLSTDFCNKINILCAEPGMGKSTTLKVLHNQLLMLNYYPKFISIKDHVAFFKTFKNSDSAESILKHFLNIENVDDSNLAIICALNRGRVCLLFDALDELDSKYLSKAIECVEKLSTFTDYNFKIWISTRKHLKDQVENIYKVHALDLSIIIEPDQKIYIGARLNSTYMETTIQNIISKIYENFSLFEQNSDVLGIPLQLYIITEVLINSVDEDGDTDIKNLMILTKLYHEFFKGKIGHALDKNKKHHKLDKFYNETKYEIVALKVCLNENDFKSLEIQNYNKSVQDIKNSLTVGIVTNFKDDVAIFEHHTFAEYFCASYFVNHYEKNGILKNIIFQPKYNTIRMLLNMKLSEESPLHLAVIYRDLDTLKNADKDEIKSSKDKASRNLLQVAICCGVNYTECKLLKLNKSVGYLTKLDVIYDKPSEIKMDIKLKILFKFLCNFCDFEKKDKLFEWSSYEYATNMNDLSIINIMIDFKPNYSLIQKHFFIRKESILGYSAIYGFINLVKILCLTCSINIVNEVKFVGKRIRWCRAIHFAIENSQIDYLKFLIINNVDINSTNSNGCTPLHIASQEGHLQCLQELIAKGGKVNSKDSIGWTPLHYAAEKGHLQCLQELIAKGSEINSKNSFGSTPLDLAAQKGHLQCLQELIAKGGEVKSKNIDDWTPLHFATSRGHLQCLQKLIAKGNEINSKDSHGWTPLHFAAYGGHLQCLQELIAKGGEVNVKTSKESTSLHFAAQKGHFTCLQELIARGGEVNFKNSNSWTPLHRAADGGHLQCLQELIAKGGEVNVQNSKGSTSLHLAARGGHLQCLQQLIDKDSEVNSKNIDGWTPLHLAAQEGHLQCLQKLIAKGGKVNVKNSKGSTPLHLAAQEGNLQCLQELIDKGGEVNSKDSHGWTPLHLAAHRGHLQCLQELIAKGGNINSKNLDGWTSLHLAAHRGHLKCLQKLISINSEVNVKISNGWTPLHLAAQNGHLQCLQELIAKSGEVNAKLPDGWTPLHLVAQKGHLKCLQELIAKGGKVNVQNSNGSTSLHLAARGGHLQCLQELIAKGGEVNSKMSDDWTALHLAAQKGHLQCLQELIAKGSEVNAKNIDGWSPLHLAADEKNLLCLQELIAKGGEGNSKNKDGWTPLHLAAKRRHLLFVRERIANDNEVHFKNSSLSLWFCCHFNCFNWRKLKKKNQCNYLIYT